MSIKGAADTSAARVRLFAAPPPSRDPSQCACARVRSDVYGPRALPTPPYTRQHMHMKTQLGESGELFYHTVKRITYNDIILYTRIIRG